MVINPATNSSAVLEEDAGTFVRVDAMKGKFVSLKNGSVTLGHDGMADTSHAVKPDAAVTVNGKVSEIQDLEPGDAVELKGDPAAVVTATRK